MRRDESAPSNVFDFQPSNVRRSIPLSLRVGVTGHRSISGDPTVERSVDEALDLILSVVPPGIRESCRWTAVAALAEGADRVVADRILARPEGRLEVILPIPVDDYVNDFPLNSRADFTRLLARASLVVVMPRENTREEAYFACGRAIVDRADVTIAIWDGHQAKGIGGTAEIVRYIRQKKRPWVWIPTDKAGLVTENLERINISV